ncbi:MAG: hypothetical protein AB7S74_13245 [Hyphomicrobium sp.]
MNPKQPPVKSFLLIVVALMTSFWAGTASARCTINSAGLSISPLTASTGTSTPASAPTPQAATFTISGTYDTNNSAGTCRVGIAFNRASLPATMARSGGGATLPYVITSSSGGGASLIYQGGGNPNSGNILTSAFSSAGRRLNNWPFSTTVTAYFQQQPSSPQRAGSYGDAITLNIYDVRGNGQVTYLTGRGFSVTGSVAMSCTIGGTSNPSSANATIPVNTSGTVNTAPIPRSFSNVVCNSFSVLQMSSLAGAVRRSTAAPTGFTNIINYAAVATYAGASSSLNTATIPTANGMETGSSGTTSSSTPTGTLSVTITPQSPSQPLISGNYNDTLRITITPQ